MNRCNNNSNLPPQAIDDPCAYLSELRAAYYALMAGRQTVEVKHNNYEQRFNKGDIAALRQEIGRLERSCPKSKTNPHGGVNGAVRAGPYSRGGIGHPYLNSPYGFRRY